MWQDSNPPPSPSPKPKRASAPSPEGPRRAEGRQPKGGRKKKLMKVTYICRSPQKKAVTYLLCFVFIFYRFFHRVFGRFVTRGVQKHEKTTFFDKSLGSSQKMWGFFSPSVVLLDLFLSRF
jgi:hypothetical protein